VRKYVNPGLVCISPIAAPPPAWNLLSSPAIMMMMIQTVMARDQGVLIDAKLILQQHVSKLVSRCFF